MAFCPPEKRHIISVFKLIQDLLAPSKVKGKNQFQFLMAKLPDTHKAKLIQSTKEHEIFAELFEIYLQTQEK